MRITITNSILEKTPSFNIIAMSMNVKVKSSEEVKSLIDEETKKINEEYSMEDVLNIPLIKEARDAYKKYGKDPSRYRLAVESLYRRIVKGNELYLINNLVDLGNILSLKTVRSVAVLDYDKIVGDVKIRLGTKDDVYVGIGRGQLDISSIPLYADDLGPFGSTTSDTPRTMITDETKKILLFIVCFSNTNIEENKNLALELFKKYASASEINIIPVGR